MGESLLVIQTTSQSLGVDGIPTQVKRCWALIFKTPLISWLPKHNVGSCLQLHWAPGPWQLLSKQSATSCHTREQPERHWGYQVLVELRARNDHIQTRFPATQTLITQDPCLATISGTNKLTLELCTNHELPRRRSKYNTDKSTAYRHPAFRFHKSQYPEFYQHFLSKISYTEHKSILMEAITHEVWKNSPLN